MLGIWSAQTDLCSQINSNDTTEIGDGSFILVLFFSMWRIFHSTSENLLKQSRWSDRNIQHFSYFFDLVWQCVQGVLPSSYWVCLCLAIVASHWLGAGGVLPPCSGVQCQGSVQVIQGTRAAGGLSGEILLSLLITNPFRCPVDSNLYVQLIIMPWLHICLLLLSYSMAFLFTDVWLQFGHVEPWLHVGQYDFPERALFPRTRQLWPGIFHS